MVFLEDVVCGFVELFCSERCFCYKNNKYFLGLSTHYYTTKKYKAGVMICRVVCVCVCQAHALCLM